MYSDLSIKIFSNADFLKGYNSGKVAKARMGGPLVTGKVVGTDGLATCIGGSLRNENEASAFHHPEIRYSFEQDIIKKVTELRDKLSGFFTGGYEEFLSSKAYENLFRRCKVDFSIIADRIGGFADSKSNLTTNFYHSIDDENTCYLAVSPEKAIETPEDLVRTFRKIYISDNHELFLGNTKVSKAELQKALEWRDSFENR